MVVVKCFIRMNDGTVKKRKSRGAGFAVGDKKYDAPLAENNEVLRIDNWYGVRRWAFYEENNITALPINKALKPRDFKPGDYENVGGDFLASLIRRALQDETKMKVIAFITMGASIVGGISSLVGTYWIHGVMNYLGTFGH